MCAPTRKFEPPQFSESYEEVQLPEVFNVTLPMNEDGDLKSEDIKTADGNDAMPTYTDDQFQAIMEETIRDCEGIARLRSIAMTKLLNWRHDIKNLVARNNRGKGGPLGVRKTSFKRVDPNMTQKRHESFVDAIYKGRKRPLAKRESKADKAVEVVEAMDDKALPFQKQVAVKETTQEWLDRAAKEHLEGKKTSRRSKLKTIMNSDGTLPAPVCAKRRGSKKQANLTTEEPITLPKRGRKPRHVPTDNNGPSFPSIAEGVGIDLNGPPPGFCNEVQPENAIQSQSFTRACTNVDERSANRHDLHSWSENANSMQNAPSSLVTPQVHSMARGLGMDHKVLAEYASNLPRPNGRPALTGQDGYGHESEKTIASVSRVHWPNAVHIQQFDRLQEWSSRIQASFDYKENVNPMP
ncbi:unnamed protein product [Calypogeia fissa]